MGKFIGLVGYLFVVEMPGVETVQPAATTDSSEESQTEQKEAPAPKPVVGIIYPPPEVRSILCRCISAR